MSSDEKIIGAIGKRFVIFINDDGKYCVYDKENKERIEDKNVDQERVRTVLFSKNKDAEDVLKQL